jgi:phytol kinase
MTSDVTAPPDGGADAACITGARRCRDEYPRQLAHLVLGVGAGALILLLPPGRPAAILAGALLVGFLVTDALEGMEMDASRSGRFVGTFIRVGETSGGGANYTGLSVLASLLLFPASSAAAGTIAFGVLDSVSTIAGLRYGRRRLPNGKSVEGTLAAIALTAPVLLLFLSPAAAVAVASVGALAELVLPVNDNLVVPFLLALLATAFA